MTRSIAALVLGLFSSTGWAASIEAQDASDSPTKGSAVEGDESGLASMDARGGGGGGRGNNGGGNKGGGNGGQGNGNNGGGNNGGGNNGGGNNGGGNNGHGNNGHGTNGQGNNGQGNNGHHASAPSRPSASSHGPSNKTHVSNHASPAATHNPSTAHKAAAVHKAAPSVAHKAVHHGSSRLAHSVAKAKHYAKPKSHAAVVFPRWKPSYHRYHLGRHTSAHWAHGVFIYSPPPARRVVVVDGRRKVVQTGSSDSLRAVDRNGDFGLAMNLGSYMSTYYGGEGSYGDLGLGLALSYRPVEAVGLELAYMHHSDTWDPNSERLSNPLAGSVKLYGFPWTRVSPFLTLGLTATQRDYEDSYFDGFQHTTTVVSDTLVGPHAGLGIEFALGEHAALDFEGRIIGYLNKSPADPSAPFAAQGTGGLSIYF